MLDYELLMGLTLTLAIIISNIGAKFIHMDFDERQQKIMAHPLARVFYIYCMAFIGIRDFRYAAIVTGIYYLIVLSF